MESLSPLSLILLFFSGLILLGWIFLRRLQSLLGEKREDGSLLLMQQQIAQLRGQISQVLDSGAQMIQQQLGQVLGHVNDRLKENAEVLQKTQQSLGERLDNAARVVGDVQKSLGGLEEANRRIYEVGKDIASLQEILRAPKLRGGLGEFLLEDLLAQVLPPDHVSTQYRFRSGEKADAVIKLGNSLVPVDAKFPLENFKRALAAATDEERTRAKKQFTTDVKKHIDAIAQKYILPDEGTYDFALMYIPAENVYYETIIKDESAGEKSLSEYALGKRVIPVSPGSFYAYLQAIVLGLKGMKVEERAKEIIRYLSRLQGDFARFRDDFDLVGKHLGHAQSSYQSADKRVEQFGQKLLSAEIAPGEPAAISALERETG
ncbi:MAG: DNA recombination protein RmuC [Deltaproteobacteria bacterium]|nr:DNA recombination protein RmuC [Deltaproteobacteria bacterium]MBI2179277.1 DNA recombination protein RmuC [Deltaproteobacteria bacterium]MBI2231875.1 DNA recombination protein RmuC [Deltaproteobacteria bacterium]MBI2364951.1 DNA recombination protein RmuC [Deltaproteobacteria bacterium]MBI2534824.1 DNA recombination protein RmuC [Deltaproteobacteria bacterium]